MVQVQAGKRKKGCASPTSYERRTPFPYVHPLPLSRTLPIVSLPHFYRTFPHLRPHLPPRASPSPHAPSPCPYPEHSTSLARFAELPATCFSLPISKLAATGRSSQLQYLCRGIFCFFSEPIFSSGIGASHFIQSYKLPLSLRDL